MVGILSAHNVVLKDYEMVLDIEWAKTWNFELIMETARLSHAHIIKLSEERMSWRANTWVENKEGAHVAVAKYVKDFQFMLDLHPSIQALTIQQQANKEIENRDKRTVRDRLAAPMLKKRVSQDAGPIHRGIAREAACGVPLARILRQLEWIVYVA